MDPDADPDSAAGVVAADPGGGGLGGCDGDEEKFCLLLWVRVVRLLTHAERLIMHPLLLLLPVVGAEVVKGERVVALRRHRRSGPWDIVTAGLRETRTWACVGSTLPDVECGYFGVVAAVASSWPRTVTSQMCVGWRSADIKRVYTGMMLRWRVCARHTRQAGTRWLGHDGKGSGRVQGGVKDG